MVRLFLLSVLTLLLVLISVEATPASTDTIALSAATEHDNAVSITVRDGDDGDDHHHDGGHHHGGSKKPVKKPVIVRTVFACSKLTGPKRFSKCTRCTKRCGVRFGVKATMIKHVVKTGRGNDEDDDGKDDDEDDDGKDDDEDDDGKDDDEDDDDQKRSRKKVKKVVYVCNKNKKCLRCRAGCRKRFGLKKVITQGEGKGRDDDDDDDDNHKY